MAASGQFHIVVVPDQSPDTIALQAAQREMHRLTMDLPVHDRGDTISGMEAQSDRESKHIGKTVLTPSIHLLGNSISALEEKAKRNRKDARSGSQRT